MIHQTALGHVSLELIANNPEAAANAIVYLLKVQKKRERAEKERAKQMGPEDDD